MPNRLVLQRMCSLTVLHFTGRSPHISRQLLSTSSRCMVLTPGKTGDYRWRLELYKRRIIAGPEKEKHRSSQRNWNYNAELYSFGKRLSEKFDQEILQQAFTHRSYSALVETEEENWTATIGGNVVSESSESEPSKNNEPLYNKGKEITEMYIKQFVSESYPLLNEESVDNIKEFLMSDDTLSHIGRSLGVTELIITQEFPVSKETEAETFLSVIGALLLSSGKERTEGFLRDFLLTHLIGQDIDELIKIRNPLQTLHELHEKQGLSPPESRLINSYGAASMLPCYHVGIFCDKKLIGKAPGENLRIAEDMAAYEALMNHYGLHEFKQPIDFNQTHRDSIKPKE